MKTYLTAIMIAICSMSYSQEFNGVAIDGDLSTFISKMKLKNYKFNKYFENGALMNGKIGFHDVELFVFVTPKTKKIFRISIYFPTKTTWYNLKSHYYELQGVLTDKYGEPGYHRESFSDPYYEGDGYEMSAVSLEKVNYISLWTEIGGNMSVSIEVSKYKQINITYDNERNVKLRDNEIKKIQENIL